MSKWYTSTYPGVRYREHPTRKHGSVRKDRYFAIRYQSDGQRKEEGLGWSTEGWTAEKAAQVLANLKSAAKIGVGPKSLSESRKIKENEIREQASKEIDLKEYWESHYLPYAKRSKPNSWDKEESHVRLHLIPHIGNIPLSQLHLHHWDDLVEKLTNKGLSQRSIEYITGTLRRVLKHALRRKIVSIPPPAGKDIGATAPKNNRRQRIILPQERDLILSSLYERDQNAWMITLFAFLTGCRASEAFNLEWRNVTSTHIAFEKTKNTENRNIPLSGPIQSLLSDMKRMSPTEKVFLMSNGMPFKEAPTAFATTVRKLKFNEGRDKLDMITFHSIRHTVATELAKVLDLRSLMDVMGWKVPAMALRYMHGDNEATRSALEMLGNQNKEAKLVPFRRRI